MLYNRRKALIVMGAATSAAVLASAAPSRAGIPPTIYSYSQRPSIIDGVLSVSVSSQAPLVAVRLRVLSSPGGTQIGELSAFAAVGATGPGMSYWQSTAPLLLPSLGTYTAVWEAEDSTGAVGAKQAELRYWGNPYFTRLAVSPTVIDARNRVVVVSGNLGWKHPGTLEVTRQQGIPLHLKEKPLETQLNFPVFDLLTDASGDFSKTVTVNGAGEILLFTTEAPYLYAAETSVTATAIVTPTRLSLTVQNSAVNLGSPVTINGFLEQQVASEWIPLPNSKVVLVTNGYGNLVTTNAQGRFTEAFTPSWAGQVVASFNLGYGNDPLYTGAQSETIAIHVRRAIAFSLMELWPADDPYSWSLHGLIDFGTNGANRPAGQPIEIQVAQEFSGPWQTVATVTSFSAGPDADQFNFLISADRTYSYIRAFAPETLDTQSAMSAVKFLGTTSDTPPRV